MKKLLLILSLTTLPSFASNNTLNVSIKATNQKEILFPYDNISLNENKNTSFIYIQDGAYASRVITYYEKINADNENDNFLLTEDNANIDAFISKIYEVYNNKNKIVICKKEQQTFKTTNEIYITSESNKELLYNFNQKFECFIPINSQYKISTGETIFNFKNLKNNKEEEVLIENYGPVITIKKVTYSTIFELNNLLKKNNNLNPNTAEIKEKEEKIKKLEKENEVLKNENKELKKLTLK